VALDQYKTQILLLHSEQSTLDSLSSGFNDRYTVHCATSGSEALNTLVDTPINVIVTAQDLPGMSGLEALREAKKRSPDTIGILLAGNSNQGLEALVGDEEVFQVVRGNVTSDGLLKLVENATRQMRLMALAGAANDTAANVDEPTEHIIMETSENGSTIISDGTGRMPALNPEKVSAAVSVGSRSVDVLVLTKDQEFLTTIKESSRGMHTVHYANTLAQADETILKHKIGVAVVDAAMVGQKVEQLTQHLRKGSARLVSIVAGRRDDGEMLMDLINRGKVYRFLLKPVSPGRARLAVEASVKHHLEAPDAAFKIKGGGTADKPVATPSAKPAPKPAPRAVRKANPKPRPKPKPAAKAKPAPKPAAEKPKQKAAKTAPVATVPVDPPLGDISMDSPIDEGLSSAFGDDGSSFAETMTGIISTVTEKFKGRDDAAPEAPAAEPATSAPTSGSGGSAAKGKIIGIVAAAIVVAAVATAWFMRGDEEPAQPVEQVSTSTPMVTEADVAFGEPEQSGVDAGVLNALALVEEARLAREAGQVFNPAGSNAIELYMAAIAADPSNVLFAAELDAVIQEALGMAETALLETRLNDADAAMQRVALADADNARLPFLEAQLAQMQLRGHMTDARSAIRDTRFEDASTSIAAARALGVADTTEIDAVAEELSSAKSEQRVDEVLALANARLEEGDLLNPANDNARYYYALVLSNDPANTAARQGLNVVASTLVLQARTEIDSGNLDDAETLLTDARAIDASSAELAATAVALAAARDAVAAAEARRQAEARQQAEADRQAELDLQAETDRLAAEAQAEQEREAAAAAALLVTAAVVDDTTAGAAGGLATESIEQAAVGLATESVEQAAAGPGSDAEEPVAPAEAPEPVAIAVRDQTPVSMSSLTRTRYVAPKYPRTAQRRGVQGWVDVVFTVSRGGTVKNLEVREADPEDVFNNSAMRAVEKWEFEPIVENGVVVEKRAGVRMMFALE
jgi:TonB family protein